MKYFFLLLILLPFWGFSQIVNLNKGTIKAIHGHSNESINQSIVDDYGNVYVVGSYQSDSVIVDVDDTLHSSTSSSSRSGFVLKYDSSGTIIFSKNFGTKCNVYSIAIGRNSDVYICGSGSAGLTLGNGVSVNLGINGSTALFIAKLDSNGVAQWAGKADGNGSDFAKSIAFDTVNNRVYMGGIIGLGTVAFWGVGNYKSVSNSNGVSDLFLACYNENGSVQWVENSSGFCTVYSGYVACDSQGNVFMSGTFYNSTLYFGGKSASSFNHYDGVIVKFDSTGNAEWMKSIGGTGRDNLTKFEVDSQDNVLIGYQFKSPVANFPDTTLKTNRLSNMNLLLLSGVDGSHINNWNIGISRYTLVNDSLILGYVSNADSTFQLGDSTYTNQGGADAYIYLLDLGNDRVVTSWPLATAEPDYFVDISFNPIDSQFVVAGSYQLSPLSYNNSVLPWSGGHDVFWMNGELEIFCSPGAMASVQVDTACDFYIFSGDTLNASGVYYDTIPTICGDSTIQLNLTILQPTYGQNTITACDSFSLLGGEVIYNDSIIFDTLINAQGCDSIVTYDVSILPTTYSTDTLSSCAPITWIDGNTYSISNYSAKDTLINHYGCDSVVNLNFTRLQTTYCIDSISSCAPLTWINGVVYDTSNSTAVDTLVNAQGCDSIVTLKFSRLQPTYGVDSIISCAPLTWINGVVYDTSNNTAVDTLVNAQGCDSIVTLNFTRLQSTYGVDSIISCAPLTWINGVVYDSSNSTALDTLINAQGCDSIVTLNYTRLHATYGIDSISSCAPLTWINGVTYSSSNTTSIEILVNAQGCDSIVSLYFTRLQADTLVVIAGNQLIAQATNAKFQWIDCLNGPILNDTNSVFNVTQNGDYQVEVIQNGCVDTSLCYSFTNVGIDGIKDLGINVYPNPVSEQLIIQNPLFISSEIVITNVIGKIMAVKNTTELVNRVDMSGYPNGTYLVRIISPKGVVSRVILKK